MQQVMADMVELVGRQSCLPVGKVGFTDHAHSDGFSVEQGVLSVKEEALHRMPDRMSEIECFAGALLQRVLFDNTLLFFLTDNGGSKAMSADNTPLRGFKGSLEEGGIRTPFIVSWPAKFSGKRTVDTPVISLDILPTALDAIGVEAPTDPAFDGRSMLPLLAGESKNHHGGPSLRTG